MYFLLMDTAHIQQFTAESKNDLLRTVSPNLRQNTFTYMALVLSSWQV